MPLHAVPVTGRGRRPEPTDIFAAGVAGRQPGRSPASGGDRGGVEITFDVSQGGWRDVIRTVAQRERYPCRSGARPRNKPNQWAAPARNLRDPFQSA
jgi:hypothetical protein